MTLRIEPFSSAYAPGVRRLNSRLLEANIDPAFHLPVGGPDEHGAFDCEPTEPLAKKQYLLVDNGEVRGGFLLQEQRFEVAGKLQWVANIQMPISEGVIDRRYALVAFQMMKMILAKKPLLFGVGMGGRLDQPSAQLVARLNWPISLVPFHFYVVNPNRFLSQIRLDGSASKVLKLVSRSGLSWGLVRAAQNASALRHRLGGRWWLTDLSAERINEWGDWADTVWCAYRRSCSLAAERDHRTLPVFLPLSRQGFEAYRFCNEGGDVVGWAALQVTPMHQNRYFGDMTVATLLDAVAVPGWEDRIIRTVTWIAANTGADVLISNQYHRAWLQAQRRVGFMEGPSNYLLALSPQLARGLDPLSRSYERAHITRADGDGRVHL